MKNYWLNQLIVIMKIIIINDPQKSVELNSFDNEYKINSLQVKKGI